MFVVKVVTCNKSRFDEQLKVVRCSLSWANYTSHTHMYHNMNRNIELRWLKIELVFDRVFFS